RGYSQCREICRPVEKALGVPVRQELLEKILPTPEQARLGREERKKLGRVFRGAPQAAGMRLLLVDDVCTTGTTLRRAAEALLAAGAARVDVAVLARTPSHGGGPA
ncbi:MAG: ComF family protein, partial [Mailhella sp.]|nr:ComF family protein [Mailhella sp.]